MLKEIIPAAPVNARVQVPGSKSITNRALVCSALAEGDSVIRNASGSEDTALFVNALNQLGVLARRNDDGLTISGTGGSLYSPKFPIPVGNAGTTLRFLLSLAALAQGTTVLSVGPRMVERPNDDLLEALQMLGVEVQFHEPLAQFSVGGGTFAGGTCRLQTDKSSQFLSSIMMAAPYAHASVSIEREGASTSSSYVAMTASVMRSFGVIVEADEGPVVRIRAGQRYMPTVYHVEPDASGASYFLAAAAIAGGEVVVEGMKKGSIQGDAGFGAILERMRCQILMGGEGAKLRSTGTLEGVDVDMNSMPDVVPTLAACALFAETPTRIRGVAHLRFKESDRLEALGTELRKLGVDITLHDDGMEIRPAPLHGAQLDTYDDHRLAMSFALVGLRIPGVSIENPECVKKSFPGFWTEFEKLYRRRD